MTPTNNSQEIPDGKIAVSLAESKSEWGPTIDCQSPAIFTHAFYRGEIYMIANYIYLQQLISDYIDHGFAPIQIHYKSKQPINNGWPELRISDIGILTGKPSRGLVDVDIGEGAALKFASWFLPKANCLFDRSSKPKSRSCSRGIDDQRFGQSGR